MQLNFHFFVDTEIELDVSPYDLHNEMQFNDFLNFLKWLAKSLEREVFVKHEGAPSQKILSVNSSRNPRRIIHDFGTVAVLPYGASTDYGTFRTHKQVGGLGSMKIRPFPWKSLFLAPFASVPVVTLGFLGTSDAGVASDFFWGIFFGLLAAVPTSFVAMLLIGVPVFLILRPYKYALMLTTCAAGFAIPFLMFFGHAPSGTTLGAAASGLAVAAAAYFLRPRSA